MKRFYLLIDIIVEKFIKFSYIVWKCGILVCIKNNF